METHLIKANDIRQCRRRAVVKVRCTACRASQNGTFHLSDVPPLTGNKSPTATAETVQTTDPRY
jgi:hypothetical protein